MSSPMKRVKVIRHAPLAPPYDRYTRLTFEQLRELSLNRISPAIAPETDEMVKARYHPRKYRIDTILCSRSDRTLRTAKVFERLSGHRIVIKQTENLDELLFDPAQLITEEAFAA